jgi:neutral ceramidase
MDDGNTKMAIVTMDLLFHSKKYARDIRNRVAAKTDIPASNIMLCCSHTHSGPWASGRLDLDALEQGLGVDENYVSELQDKLEKLIIEARENTFDAKVGTGIGRCGSEQGVGGNRRAPDGPADPSVCVIGVQDSTGSWRGCLVGYALHPTFLHAESTLVSADYPAYIRKYLSWAKPGMITLFAQGTSGDQSSRYFRDGQNFEEACRVGTTIGVEVNRVLESMELSSDVDLLVKSVETELKLRVYPEKSEAQEKVRRAEQKLEELKKGGAPYLEIRNAELELLGAEDILGYIILAEKGVKPDLLKDELPAEVHIIGIGDTRIVGLQGEVFVEFGLEIKKRSPFRKTFVFELANGAAPGYIYTKEALKEGGYETDTSMLAEESGSMLVDEALKLLEDTI